MYYLGDETLRQVRVRKSVGKSMQGYFMKPVTVPKGWAKTLLGPWCISSAQGKTKKLCEQNSPLRGLAPPVSC